ncbi:MAG TPA: M23 family metallopeptidase [Methyloceanibacter sp.]|nr:M23 family metallopeptidase [Methyloceanibacter sp.]
MLKRAILALSLAAGPAAAIELELPVACAVGTDCFIQQYVDRDKAAGVQDYACGGETYDGHDGTDIRLRSTAEVEKGVAVLAAAAGTVVGLRDGIPDRLVRTKEDRDAVANIECGNGVRIDHGGGWVTQYCHLRQGSVAVKKGEQVKAGTKLGEIGYSGEAAFAHVHLGVSKDDQWIDPFLPDPNAACGAQSGMLWSEAAKAALSYREGVLLGLGFADHPVSLEELETGASLGAPTRNTPLVLYAWAINLQGGDEMKIALKRGEEVLVENAETLDRNKAQYMLFAGKKAPAGGWPEGPYTGVLTVLRDGKPVISETTAPLALDE